MNFTFTKHIGDGVTTALSFSFAGQDLGYLSPSNIVVTVDGVPAPFNINVSDPNKVYMLTPPRSGSDVVIRRIMPNTIPFSDFRGGNAFKAETLNYTQLQQLYLLQELLDGFLPEGFYAKQNVDFGGFRLTNIGEAIDETDAVTKAETSVIEERLRKLEANFGDIGNDTSPWSLIAASSTDVLSPPYTFRSAILFINGVAQTFDYSYVVVDNKIMLAERLEEGDKVFALIGRYPAPPTVDALEARIAALELAAKKP